MELILNTPEMAMGEYVPMTLVTVLEVHATETPEHYRCLVVVNVTEGTITQEFMSGPNDPYGLGPAVRQWLIDNEGSYVIQPYVAPPPSPYTVMVTDLWGDLTDDEAEDFDAAMATASPLRLRKQFNTATSFISNSELFAFVLSVMTSAIGATRANEVLGD